MEQIHKARMAGQPLYIKADFGQSASPIRYAIDNGDDIEFVCTPFQVADARHSKSQAVALVKNYLARMSG